MSNYNLRMRRCLIFKCKDLKMLLLKLESGLNISTKWNAHALSCGRHKYMVPKIERLLLNFF